MTVPNGWTGDQLLSAARVRAILDVPDRTFRRWITAGRFPKADLRIGRALRWKAETVQRFIDGISQP